MPKTDNFLHENHQGGPNLTLLNVLDVLNELNVLNMPKDASLACWALFATFIESIYPKLTISQSSTNSPGAKEHRRK